MALERRNALAAKLLGVVKHDVEQRYAIGMSLHTLDSGKNSKRRGIENGMGSELLGLASSATLLVPLIAMLGAGLVAFLTNKLLGWFDKDPSDPYKEDKSIGDRVKSFLGKSPEESKVTASNVAPVALSNDVSPLIGKGTEIPTIKTAKSQGYQRNAIARGASLSGVDYELLYAVAGSESSFRDNASASTSSAQGILQFVAPTWTYLVKEFGLDYSLDDRNDPAKASHVAGLYLNRITKVLTKTLGRKPSYGETYLGYFLGPTGGANFLKALIANPNALGADLFPKAAAANKNIFFDKNGQPLTLGASLAKLEGKIGSYAADATGAAPKNVASQSQEAPAVQTASANPKGGGSQISGQAAANTASAKPTEPQITIPTDQIENAKLAARKTEEPAPGTAQAQPTTVASAPQASGAKQSDDQGLPFRGRDGRLYKG